MKRKTAIILLIIITLAGSFMTFYVSNMIFSDVGNTFYGLHDTFFVGSIPGFMIVPDVVLATLFVIRYYMRPKFRRKMVKLYTTLLAVFSVIGIATAVYAGAKLYDSFLEPYPFPGYVVISIVVHALLLAGAIYVKAALVKKMPEDPAKRKIQVGYVIYTLVLAILIFFAYNRLGALLWMPVYVHARTLYMTFPFYIWLLVPMALLAHVGFRVFDTYDRIKNGDIINLIIVLCAHTILSAVVIYLGMNNTQFISAISPALALERLATMPIDTILQVGLGYVFGIYFLINSIVFKKKGLTVKFKR